MKRQTEREPFVPMVADKVAYEICAEVYRTCNCSGRHEAPCESMKSAARRAIAVVLSARREDRAANEGKRAP